MLLLILGNFISCLNDHTSIGYKNSGIYLDQIKSAVEKELGSLKQDPNGLNQGISSMEDYVLFPDQIKIDTVTLNPVLYFSFNDDRLIYFSASYTIDNVLFDNRDMPALLAKLSDHELRGIKELMTGSKTSRVNHEGLYSKSIRLDTIPQQFKTINYSIAAIP